MLSFQIFAKIEVMKNWSIDENYLKNKSPRAYKIWKIQQQINYGLDEGEKINRKDLIKYWGAIAPFLDSSAREFIEYILWK